MVLSHLTIVIFILPVEKSDHPKAAPNAPNHSTKNHVHLIALSMMLQLRLCKNFRNQVIATIGKQLIKYNLTLIVKIWNNNIAKCSIHAPENNLKSPYTRSKTKQHSSRENFQGVSMLLHFRRFEGFVRRSILGDIKHFPPAAINMRRSSCATIISSSCIPPDWPDSSIYSPSVVINVPVNPCQFQNPLLEE